MKTKTIKRWEIEKEEVEHTFVAELVDQGSYVSLTLEGEYAEPDKINGQYAIVTDVNLKPWNVKGISVTEELWNEISTAFEEARAQKRKAAEEKKMRIEEDRPAPKLDKKEYYLFSMKDEYGIPVKSDIYDCPDGEEGIYLEAVSRAMKKENPKVAKWGIRDESCRFPGTKDVLIPEEYDGKGYEALKDSNTYYLPRALVKAEVEKIKEKARKIKEQKEKEIQNAIMKAKETGKEVIISKHVEECNSYSEECDLDIVYKIATPDGKIVYRREHTY